MREAEGVPLPGGRMTSGSRGIQAEAALLDDQAAVFHVEQPGVLGDGPGLGRGDAQLQPQRGGTRRHRLAGDVRRLAGRAEDVDQAHLVRHVGERPVDLLAEDLGSVRVDRDDPPAVPLHVGGYRVRRLVRGPAGTDHGDGVVAGQDALDDSRRFRSPGHPNARGGNGAGAGGTVGPRPAGNRPAAACRAWYSSSVRSRSAAATLLSSWPTLVAPGMATTRGGGSPTPARSGPAWRRARSATSRRVASRAPARSRFSGRNSGLRGPAAGAGWSAVVAAAEQPLRQRAVGDHEPVVRARRTGTRSSIGVAGRPGCTAPGCSAPAGRARLGRAPALQRVVADADLPHRCRPAAAARMPRMIDESGPRGWASAPGTGRSRRRRAGPRWPPRAARRPAAIGATGKTFVATNA